MRQSLRNDVFIARAGGEEFAIVVRDVSCEGVVVIAERLRAAVHATPLRNQKTGTEYGPVTVSIGACMAAQAAGADDLYRKVDMALYSAKAAGRNRVEMYRSDIESGSLSDRFLYRRSIA
jgi:diguanylate cyclase